MSDPFEFAPQYALTVQIPVLNRPLNAAKVIDSLLAASEVPLVPIFICSPGDTAQIDACRATEAEVIVVPWEPGAGDFARKHNYAFHQLDFAAHVFLGADDLEFEPHWDTRVLNEAQRTNAGVIGTDDDANPLVKRGKHSTHPLVSRSYIEQVGGTWHDGPGVIYHEGYDHQYVDTELVAAAMSRGEWAFARGSVVRHLHPFFNKQARNKGMDDTYRKALRDSDGDATLFRERQALANPRRSRSRRAL